LRSGKGNLSLSSATRNLRGPGGKGAYLDAGEPGGAIFEIMNGQ